MMEEGGLKRGYRLAEGSKVHAIAQNPDTLLRAVIW